MLVRKKIAFYCIQIHTVIAIHFHSSVANSSHNKYTKSCPKIYQIYTKFISVTTRTIQCCLFNPVLLLQYISFSRWSTIAVEQGHQKDAASSISTSLTLAVTDFEPRENLTFQHLQLLHFYSFCGTAHY